MQTGNEEIHEGPGGLLLIIDRTDSDTPAMVWLKGQPSFTSTFNCALFTEKIDDEIDLTLEQLNWLVGFEDEVDEAYAEARKGMPEYA